MCKCGEKSDGKNCKENNEAVEAGLEQKPKSNCTGDQHESGDCCSTKVVQQDLRMWICKTRKADLN